MLQDFKTQVRALRGQPADCYGCAASVLLPGGMAAARCSATCIRWPLPHLGRAAPPLCQAERPSNTLLADLCTCSPMLPARLPLSPPAAPTRPALLHAGQAATGASHRWRIGCMTRDHCDNPAPPPLQWPFNPDSYLGYRGPDELETVTGGCSAAGTALALAGGPSCRRGAGAGWLMDRWGSAAKDHELGWPPKGPGLAAAGVGAQPRCLRSSAAAALARDAAHRNHVCVRRVSWLAGWLFHPSRWISSTTGPAGSHNRLNAVNAAPLCLQATGCGSGSAWGAGARWATTLPSSALRARSGRRSWVSAGAPVLSQGCWTTAGTTPWSCPAGAPGSRCRRYRHCCCRWCLVQAQGRQVEKLD